MGYNTCFSGTLKFNKNVTWELREYINKFSATRRMKRDVVKIKRAFSNWQELCFNGELGEDGEYFIGDDSIVYFGRDKDDSIVNHNIAPGSQPGLWCQWIINNNGELEWDGSEKFYDYETWLVYLIDNFFKPLGYVLNGDIEWQGDEYDDFGTIHVVDNVVTMEYGIRVSSIKDIDTETLINELESRGYKVAV